MTKETAGKYIFELFKASFIMFIVLAVLEFFIPGFVTNYFNPVWILIISVFSAIISIAVKYYRIN